jgi:serine protease Do
MRRPTLFLIGLTAAVSFLLGLVAAGSRSTGDLQSAMARPHPVDSRPLTVSVAPIATLPSSAGVGVDFSVVAAQLNGAVVNVDAASRGTERSTLARRVPRDGPDDDSAPHEGSGSGFIIDRSGYILTNHHVIEGADRVTVTLGDGRVFRAAIVGVDPAIDVALLQIAATDPLPVAPLGDSSGLRVGEWVCAIGNPLGYVHSVTVGVVSFLGRKLFDASLDAFIQTDAAISFGNSGGPLINSRGQVVGITTAISSQASNIGFAIPIGQVMAVLPQLKDRGRVARGFIGVTLTDATPDLRRALHLGPERGALVEDVTPDTPADHAGLRPYDVVTGADGQPVRSDEELIRYISAQAPGTVTRLDVWRDGAARTMPVRLTERPVPRASRTQTSAARNVRPAAGQEQAPMGLTVRDLDAATVRRLNIPDSMLGVLIVDVDAAGPARLARIRPGQVLLEIDRQRVTSAAEYRTAVAALRPGSTVALFVYDQLSDQRAIYAIVLDSQQHP